MERAKDSVESPIPSKAQGTKWDELKNVEFAGGKTENNMEKMTNLEEIHNCELKMVSENSDVLGYNIDSKLIIWPERHRQAERAREMCVGENGEYDDTKVAVMAKKYSVKFGEEVTPERLKETIEEELSKDRLLDETLSKLPEGVKLRITPHAPQSAFSVANSKRIVNENGENRFQIDKNVMSQVRKIREKAKGSELLVVMNQLHIGENGKQTSNMPTDMADYIALCKSFVEQSGYSGQSGKGLVLELGNECNMSHESDGPLFKTEAFAETVDPEAYAKFYFETAKALKTAFPDIKLSLTGTAFYDYDFVKEVVNRVQSTKSEDDSLNDVKLIDTISFHPYRKTVEGPTPFMKNGITMSDSEVREKAREYWDALDEGKKDAIRREAIVKLTENEKAIVFGLSEKELEDSIAYRAYTNFDQQLESLKSLANQIGAEVTVGEISFYTEGWGESINENEQEKNANHGREKGYVSLLWPGEQIVKHENPR